ncbi:MAG: transglutaminase domain-containing protein [Candidatus Bathyarchaeota archaeon]|jgi:transglutaminase-like putative cysteine protease
MKGYQKLAAFLVVLLFSVGLMSVAIDILGDITDLEFQTGTRPVDSVEAGGERVEGERGEGQAVKVESLPPDGESVLFEITYPTGTEYLRWTIGERYEGGEWEPSEQGQWTGYAGEELTPEAGDTGFEGAHFFTVRPFFNLSGPLPGTLKTIRVGGLETLERNSHLELFSSPEEFDWGYGIGHAVYTFPRSTLEAAKVTPSDRYLQVPEELERRFAGLASGIVEGHSSPYGRLRALEDYLMGNYEYDEGYERAPNGSDPVEWFLFEERKGMCNQFNTAMVLLARSIGIPIRPVGGYSIEAESNYQIVKQKDAHIWAEAHFEGLGWITFDATPPRTEERPQEVMTYPTVTNITYNDPMVLKGDSFQVHGTVTLEHNGSSVDGLTVEVFLTFRKNDTDTPCGTGIVHDGFFNLSCEASPELMVGDYNLIAHTFPGGIYEESWSDPPITIMTETEATISAPAMTFVNRSVTIEGTVVDKSNGEPIANTSLTLQVGNETMTFLTDGRGRASTVHTFRAEGNETLRVEMEGSEYYLGSNSSFGIAVRPPPEPKPGLFMIITTYPYNVITFAGVAIIIGSVLFITRRKEEEAERSVPVKVFREEMPRDFKNYRDGVVKLFNWFYNRSDSKLEDIEDSMTPREFQAAVLMSIPEKGDKALEYLVTAFEIADYSTSEIGQEMYEKSLAAVELLDGLMEYG